MTTQKKKGYTFQHDGKDYFVSLLTQQKKDEFSQELKARAVAAVVASRPFLDDEQYDEAFARITDRVSGGAYNFYSELTQKSLKTPGGILLLSRILFGVSEEEMVRLFTARKDDIRAIIDVVLKESLAQADPPEAA